MDADQAWSECLTQADVLELARRWVDQANSENLEAGDLLNKLFWNDPDRAFLVILALVRSISDAKTLSFFSAGPLEDFLGINGEKYIDAIHALAVKNRELRLALGGVWQGSMPKNVWRRVEILAEYPTKYGARPS